MIPWHEMAAFPSLAARAARPLEASGTVVVGSRVEAAAFGYGVFAPDPPAGPAVTPG